jgi:release factor glutamine methyltransferase
MVIVNFHGILAKMKNSKEIFRGLRQQITLKDEEEEIQSILYLAIENILHLSRTEIISEKLIPIDAGQQNKLAEIVSRLNQEEPIQYILEEAHFFGRKFKVTPAVLIPRQETELLVEEALKEINPYTPGTILDIGTGSGCIGITLAKELGGKKIIAVDISESALKVAKENAIQLDAALEFQQVNILTKFPYQKLEMIVSNPPYVAFSEKLAMKKNVLEYEPHLALFVSDHNALIFYNVIAEKAFDALQPNGKAVVEINEKFGKEVSAVFNRAGFKKVQVIKDLRGKDRIVSATR